MRTTSEAAPPENEAVCLPPGYRQRCANETLDSSRESGSYWSGQRLADAGRYQFHVYTLARQLIADHGLESALDVGCGVGVKLRNHVAPVCDDIVGLDQAGAIATARELAIPGEFVEADLEAAGVDLGRTFDLIICADVLEHLLDPRPAMAMIARHAHERTIILLSTPDRLRRRGRACMESLKPEHVREWSREEFARFAEAQGLEVHESRLTPQDETPIRSAVLDDLRYRARLAPTSRLCCTILLCRKKAA